MGCLPPKLKPELLGGDWLKIKLCFNLHLPHTHTHTHTHDTEEETVHPHIIITNKQMTEVLETNNFKTNLNVLQLWSRQCYNWLCVQTELDMWVTRLQVSSQPLTNRDNMKVLASMRVSLYIVSLRDMCRCSLCSVGRHHVWGLLSSLESARQELDWKDWEPV